MNVWLCWSARDTVDAVFDNEDAAVAYAEASSEYIEIMKMEVLSKASDSDLFGLGLVP